VELLGLAASHARRIVEDMLRLRYHLLARPSRFKATRALRDLFQVRGTRWPVPAPEPAAAEPTAAAAAKGGR
jgi:hypothetical protein